MKTELGDYQTPLPLAQQVLASLGEFHWQRVLEPTCGQGRFIQACLELSSPVQEIIGIELQGQYIQQAAHLTAHPHVQLRQGNIFEVDLQRDLTWRTNGPLLVIGNPPWVTNAALGALGSSNLPRKHNLKNHTGLQAQTGAANFDLAEAIWIKLLTELAPQQPAIAFLCKLSVARNVLQFAYQRQLPIEQAWIRRIDAARWFDAATDAGIFFVQVGEHPTNYHVPVYADLETSLPDMTMSVENGLVIADIQRFSRVAFVGGTCEYEWRQGLKHDATEVMELVGDESGQLWTKQGQLLDVETENIYPLLKSTDVYHGRLTPTRWVIVPQRTLTDDPRQIQSHSPRLWAYLHQHRQVFEARKSSIYRGKPPFTIFGIGPYAFSPYKVVISGFHKKPMFRVVGPYVGKPMMVDDTCYFISFNTAPEAALVHSLLSEPVCFDYLQAITFWDAKRPITKTVLQRLQLLNILQQADREVLLERAQLSLSALGDYSIDETTVRDFHASLVEPEGQLRLF
ncbi:MAG: restriction endonuclease NspV [Chloroflexota bacterium]|nr:MAG: restriction endonuclease NspV [Chloroflexota bacterium]